MNLNESPRPLLPTLPFIPVDPSHLKLYRLENKVNLAEIISSPVSATGYNYPLCLCSGEGTVTVSPCSTPRGRVKQSDVLFCNPGFHRFDFSPSPHTPQSPPRSINPPSPLAFPITTTRSHTHVEYLLYSSYAFNPI